MGLWVRRVFWRCLFYYYLLLLKTHGARVNVRYCNRSSTFAHTSRMAARYGTFRNGKRNCARRWNRRASSNRDLVATKEQCTFYRYHNPRTTNVSEFRIVSSFESFPAIVHLAAHLENGRRAHFTTENARASALSPPPTTLIAFFSSLGNNTVNRDATLLRNADTLRISESPTR